MTRFLVAVVLLIARASGAGAENMARGPGATTTCAGYLAEVANRSSDGAALQVWVLAFLTGYMAAQPDDPTAKLTNEEILKAVQTYCGRQPSQRLVDAANLFAAVAISSAARRTKP